MPIQRKRSSPVLTIFLAICALAFLIYLVSKIMGSGILPSLGDMLGSHDGTVSVTAPNGTLTLEVATSSLAQEKGLGDRDSLGSGKGMLFEFSAPGTYGFWMKDMKFSLDMIWLDENKRVEGVTSNIPANSYPSVFFPPAPVSAVIEVNAGEAGKLGIATGTLLNY